HSRVGPCVRERLAGRARNCEERLRAVALRLVQRPQCLLPRVRAACARTGNGVQRLPADGGGPLCLLDRRGGVLGRRGTAPRLLPSCERGALTRRGVLRLRPRALTTARPRACRLRRG